MMSNVYAHYIEGTNRYALLNLARWDGKNYVIMSIDVPLTFRRRGYGSELLRTVCSLADRERINLHIIASSLAPDIPDTVIVQWLSKFDFEPCPEYKSFPIMKRVRATEEIARVTLNPGLPPTLDHSYEQLRQQRIEMFKAIVKAYLIKAKEL